MRLSQYDLEDFLAGEMGRLHLDHNPIVPSQSISFDVLGENLYFWDDHAECMVPISKALDILKGLHDKAGWRKFWEAFRQYRRDEPAWL